MNFGTILGTDLYSTGINNLNSFVQGHINEYFVDRARPKNFEWSQKEAKAADERQRAQYKDLYSPQAMMGQYKAAGLSPSMMMSGGASAVGGTPSGNMGTAAMGPYPTANAMTSTTPGLQNELMQAQIDNLNSDTISKDLFNQIQKLKNSTFNKEWKLMNITTGGDENGIKTISGLVNECKSFDQFKNKVPKYWELDHEMYMFIQSEEGQKALRAIYEANKEFTNEIAVLENSQENAELMLKITKLLNSNDFASKSAQAQKEELEKTIEDAKLTARERQAFNNILDKMGENTWTDIAIVMLTLLKNNISANYSYNNSKSIVHKE